jgi:DNA-binding PadR family transcriptional regulator
MEPDRMLGGFEHLLLLTVLRLGERAYGVSIRKEILDLAGKDVAVGAIYTALDRLSKKGFVESWLGEPTTERGGRAKRFYRVTSAGRAALVETDRTLKNVSKGLKLAKGGAHA